MQNLRALIEVAHPLFEQADVPTAFSACQGAIAVERDGDFVGLRSSSLVAGERVVSSLAGAHGGARRACLFFPVPLGLLSIPLPGPHIFFPVASSKRVWTSRISKLGSTAVVPRQGRCTGRGHGRVGRQL
jgi:hypothetical protein